ncbi:branched-chain amino acid ABC transporter permease [Variovorax sp. RTB1]|uniref:branched-chain amino acid ABC transporter permease n=1 Tax=Variovorax sp. RTB1 TaxID=3048631 RepID=UPI002B229C1C|nr:branched-chain amino acid ABC transporter permease [Variovorax sp. RTB1]MEB0111261.1 branched-chain amino acid ABC transporter permease [Variovorax sp. RTB1]
MAMPSFTLLTQAIVSGLFTGAIYGLLGLGLSLSWGLLRQINLAHFGLAFASAYLTYALNEHGVDSLFALLIMPPVFFVIGAAIQWVMARFKVSPFNSLLVTFGLTIILEALLQWIWTADYRRLETPYGDMKLRVGGIYFPLPEMITLGISVAMAAAVWLVFRRSDIGKPIRAAAEDAPIAVAFGINEKALALGLAGLNAALASIAGVCIALTYTLAPSQIFTWVGVVFAVVMLGGLGRPWGPLIAGCAIGVVEALTMAIAAPAWAPLVSFSLLLVMLLTRPGRA